MTAFLFIPTAADTGLGHRVDFANIGSLFAEAEAPAPRHPKSQTARIGLMVLILLGVIGDTLLVACPEALAGHFAADRVTQAVHRVAT